jgi:hypothetical protein
MVTLLIITRNHGETIIANEILLKKIEVIWKLLIHEKILISWICLFCLISQTLVKISKQNNNNLSNPSSFVLKNIFQISNNGQSNNFFNWWSIVKSFSWRT